MRYDIHYNPPQISDARIEKLQNFDALLTAFQAGRYEIHTDVGELSDAQVSEHADFDALLEQWRGYEVCTDAPQLSDSHIESYADFDAMLERLQGYEIHTDVPQLSDADINAHQDFEALLQRAQQSSASNSAENRPAMTVERDLPTPQAAPVSRNRFYLWLAPFAAAAALIAFLMRSPQLPETGGGFVAPAPLALVQPLPQIEKSFATFTLTDNDNDTTLLYSTGSKISVPASAFMDKNGKPIKGKVDIQYREMHDHVDMFIAGVPQQASRQHPQQAAAAVQVQAFQNGEPVYLQPDKSLNIELITTLPADMPTEDLAVYAYSPNEDAWKYQKADKIEILNAPIASDSSYSGSNPRPTPLTPDSEEGKKAIAALEKKFPAPKAPQKLSTNDVETFDLDFKTEEFPELAGYSGILWTTVDQSKSYQDLLLSREWTSMKIQRKGDSEYALSLTDGKTNITVDIQPVAENAKDADKLHIRRVEQYAEAKKAYDEKIQQALAQWQPTKPNASDADAPTKTIKHRFEATQLGLWACANPLKSSSADQTVEIATESGKAAEATALYVAIPKRRIYYSLPANGAKIHYTPDMLLWAVDKDKQIRRLRLLPDESDGNTASTLRLQYLPASKKIQTEQDLRLYLAEGSSRKYKTGSNSNNPN